MEEKKAGSASSPAEVSPGSPRGPGEPPESLERATEGAEVDGAGESSALDFLLGPTVPLTYDVGVKFDTPAGTKKLVFVIEQIDGDRIIELEEEYRKGIGPMAKIDDIGLNAAVVTEATKVIREPALRRQIDPSHGQFIGDARNPAEAMKKRFEFQPGLLDGVSAEIRRISGYERDRVAMAERATVEAVGNS